MRVPTPTSTVTTVVLAAPRRPVDHSRPTAAREGDARGPLECEGLLDQFAAQMRDVLWLATADGRELLWLSPAATRLFGITPQALYVDAAKGLALIHPEDRGALVLALRADRRSAGVQEFRLRLDDGTVRWIRQRTFPIRAPDGRLRWFAGIAEDVTAERRAGDHLQRTLRDLAALMPALCRSLEAVGYFSPARAEGLAAAEDRDAERVATSLAALTRRERQVHDLTVRGQSTKEIAATLGCSPKTVAVHRGQMMRKLGVRSVAELVRLTLGRIP
jgi:PAS domain S-box-containing protein